MKTLHQHLFSPALGMFVIRLVAGAIFIYAGVGKLSNMEQTIGFFGAMGIGVFLTWVVALVETVGGVAIIVGYFSRFFAVLLAIIMIVAIFKVKYTMGFAAAQIDIMLLASMIAILFSGCGRYSVCALFHKNCDDTSCQKDCGCHHD